MDTKTIEQAFEQVFEQVPTEESVAALEHAEIVEEYATWLTRMKGLKSELDPITKHVGLLANKLQSIADELADPADKAEIEGLMHNAQLGPKGKQVTEVDKNALIDAVGESTYMDLAKVSITDIRNYTNPVEQEDILTEELIGKRRIKVVNKA